MGGRAGVGLGDGGGAGLGGLHDTALAQNLMDNIGQRLSISWRFNRDDICRDGIYRDDLQKIVICPGRRSLVNCSHPRHAWHRRRPRRHAPTASSAQYEIAANVVFGSWIMIHLDRELSRS